MVDAGKAEAGDDLDPEIRRFQREIAAAYARHGDLASLPLAERRLVAERVRAPWRIGGPRMRRTEEIAAAGVRVRIYRPDDSPILPAMVYLHGGGWTMFSLDTHDRLMREYAARARIAVVGVDYSLAPEARFPVAIDEIVAVVDWLRREGAGHGLDPGRIAIGGDSAGANLAMAACLKLRAQAKPLPRAMLLNYGAFSASPESFESYRRYDGEAYNLTAPEMAGFWRLYARDDADLLDPLVSPILADPIGLPPAFLAIAGCDVLADENAAIAGKLKAAGIETERRVYDGAVHSFLEAVSVSPLADRALGEASDWLAARLAPPAILFVGAGRMGQALIRGWSGFVAPSFFDPAVAEIEGARKLADIGESADPARPLVVMIAVKPQMMAGVLPKLAALAAKDILFVSIAAGIEIATLRAALGSEARIVRAMPNTPVSVGAGMTAAVAGPGVDAGQRALVGRLFGAVGTFIWLDDESGLDAVTAVSGSGPAYFFRVAEALTKAGTAAGLVVEAAQSLARATLSGAGAVAAARAEPLDSLREEVTSPRGTTAAALAVLDTADLDATVADAVAAAVARARALARGD
jgi:acetyl esterase